MRLGAVPAGPRRFRNDVVLPVAGVSELTREALGAAMSMGDTVVAVNVVHPGGEGAAARLAQAWEDWAPGVPLVQRFDEHYRIDAPLLDLVAQLRAGESDEPARGRVSVLVAEVEPVHVWQRVLQNQRGAVIARSLRRHGDVVVCRMRFPVGAPVA